MLEGGLDMFTGFVDFGAKFLNDAAHIFDDEDGTSWQQDVAYMFKNLEISFKEGIPLLFLAGPPKLAGFLVRIKNGRMAKMAWYLMLPTTPNKQRGQFFRGTWT